MCTATADPVAAPAPASAPCPLLMTQRHTIDQLAAELFIEAKFRALQLGTWLHAPDTAAAN